MEIKKNEKKLRLKDYNLKQLKEVIKDGECTGNDCKYCPLEIFDNEKTSCYEIAKQFLAMLEKQEK